MTYTAPYGPTRACASRSCIGCDIDDDNCAIAARRLQQKVLAFPE